MDQLLEVTMIIRLIHAKVRAGKQDQFRQILELLALPEIQAKNGMLAFYPGQPLGPESNEFILVTVWKGHKSVEMHHHEEWIQKVIPHEALPLLEEWHVHGYKSFGVLEQPLKPLFQNI